MARKCRTAGVAVIVLVSLIWVVLQTIVFDLQILGYRSSERIRQFDEEANVRLCDNNTLEYNSNGSTTTSSSFPGLSIVAAFNHRNDSFKRTGPVDASFSYIEKWYRSVHQHPEVTGVVLHNMFNETFGRQWHSRQVKFVHVNSTNQSFRRGANRPINDMRFFVIENFLKSVYRKQPPASSISLPSYVLISDSHDVTFLRNPFEYMMETDKMLGEHQLYVGEEFNFQSRKMHYDIMMNKSSVKCFGKPLDKIARMINCGLVGGHISVVQSLLQKLNKRMERGAPNQVCDQISLYYVLQKDYGDKFISGYPFNAMFHRNQSRQDTLAFVAHK